MSPAASMEFRVPGNYKEQPQPSSSPYCQHPGNPSNPGFMKFACDNAGGVGNGGEGSGGFFNCGRSVPGSAVRPKPRLAKLRKGPASRISRSSASNSLDSGFNPFQSGSRSSDQLKDDSGGTSGFPINTKIGGTSGECASFGFVFGENSNLGGSNSSSNNTDTEERGGNFDRIGVVPAMSGTTGPMGEDGITAEKHRFNDAQSSRGGGDCSFSGLSFGIKDLCNEEKVETGGKRESVKFDKTDFVLGTGWIDRKMKSEDRGATSGSERGAEQDKGGQFQNVVQSSFVCGAMSNNLGVNSADYEGMPPLHDQQISSRLNQASFEFVAGEPTTSSSIYAAEREGDFRACFVDSSGNNEMKENVKPDSVRHGKVGSMSGDNRNHSVGGKEESSDRGQPLSCGMHKREADIGSGCQFDNDRSLDSNEDHENNNFVFRSGNESCSSHKTAEPEVSEQVNVESSANQGSISGDGFSTTSLFEKPSDVKLAEDLKKLNIDNLEKTVHYENKHFCSFTTKAPENVNDTFVFKSCRPDSTSSIGMMSTSNKMDKEAAGNGNGIDVDLNNGSNVGLVDENLFVFSASASTYSGSSGVSSRGFEKCQFSQSSDNSEGKFKGDVDPSSFPPFGLGTTTKCGTYAAPEKEREVESIGSGFFSMDFKVPQWNTFTFSANTDNASDRKSEHGVKTKACKDMKLKKTRGKARRHDVLKQKSLQKTDSGKSSAHINIASTECYSPMDFSPYEESIVTEHCSSEGSVKLNPPSFTEVNCTPLGRSQVSTDSKGVSFSDANVDSQSKLFSGADVASGDARTDIHQNASPQHNHGSRFQFASNSGTRTEQFMFTASASGQTHALPIKRQRKKKYRPKASHHVSVGASSVHASSLGSTFTLTGNSGRKQCENGIMSFESKVHHKSMTDEEMSTSTLGVAEEDCEKWKLRGNQAYKDRELYKAEDFYTWGINCVPSGDAYAFPVKALVHCYSNRAATRMALGRVREALQDCLTAVALDPGFLKAQIRAANCHLMLGELEEAMQNFNKCTMSGGNVCLDRQLVIAASDGLQKAQKVAEYISQAEELLKLKTSQDAVDALESIAQGMLISLHSEKLLELKAETLCLLQKYEDAIKLCEQTLDFAEKNFPLVSSNNCNHGSEVKTNLNVKLWRSRILSKCYFHLGRLEAALGLLDKHESGRGSQDSDPLAITITELLKHKNAGNEAFRSGKHAEAVDHYTSAITCSIESRSFAAVCFCNRAAAYQGLGQIADAISDCSIAVALDENYVKAISRRANLHEKIRDYKQAASDLQKLVSILEKQSPRKAKQSGSSNSKELEQSHQRLFSMEEHAKKDISLDLYLILGVKRADTASEIKKAYRKAALRHHPDKAAQSLVRSESGDDGRVWKEIADLVHKDSDRLFKMIGEAYAVLSDPEKRTEYDLKEDMKSASRGNNVNRGASRRESDFYSYTYSYPFERSTNRRHWQGGYRSRNSYSRW